LLDSDTALIRPPPLSPLKLARPFTTSQSLRCSTSGGVEAKVIVRVPSEQRNVLTTDPLEALGPSANVPPPQKAESPMVDPERTSPFDSCCALGGARRVLIGTGSVLSLAAPVVVPPSPRTASSDPRA